MSAHQEKQRHGFDRDEKRDPDATPANVISSSLRDEESKGKLNDTSHRNHDRSNGFGESFTRSSSNNMMRRWKSVICAFSGYRAVLLLVLVFGIILIFLDRQVLMVRLEHSSNFREASRIKSGVNDDESSEENQEELFVPQKIHFVSFSNTRSSRICSLASTIQFYGGCLQVLGWDQSDTFFDGTKCGKECDGNVLINKMIWMKHFVRNRKAFNISDNDLLVFLDGFDIVAQRDLKSLSKTFTKITDNRRGVIFNGEKNCFPFDTFDRGGWAWGENNLYRVQSSLNDPPQMIYGREMCTFMRKKVTMKPGTYAYLNSGGYIGDPLTLLAFLNAFEIANRENDNNDQPTAQRVLAQFPEINVIVDANAEIFFSLQNFEEGDVSHISANKKQCTADYHVDQVTRLPPPNMLTGARAYFLHFNGNGKPYQDSCFDQVTQDTRDLLNQTFYDIDRQNIEFVQDLCPEFSRK